VRVVLTGGTVREADGAMTGPIVHSSLALFRFDLAVIGAAAIDGRGAVLVDDVDDARIAQDVLHAARGSRLIADASKFARHAPVAATALSDLGCLVTDAPLEPALTLACGQSGTEIVIPR